MEKLNPDDALELVAAVEASGLTSPTASLTFVTDGVLTRLELPVFEPKLGNADVPDVEADVPKLELVVVEAPKLNEPVPEFEPRVIPPNRGLAADWLLDIDDCPAPGWLDAEVDPTPNIGFVTV